MRAKRKYANQRIVAILSRHVGGVTAKEIIRRHGIALDTFNRWRRQFSAMTKGEPQRLKALEDEHRRLKRMVADKALKSQMLKKRIGKGVVAPAERRAMVTTAQAQHGMGGATACRYIGVHRSLPRRLPERVLCEEKPRECASRWRRPRGRTSAGAWPSHPNQRQMGGRFGSGRRWAFSRASVRRSWSIVRGRRGAWPLP